MTNGKSYGVKVVPAGVACRPPGEIKGESQVVQGGAGAAGKPLRLEAQYNAQYLLTEQQTGMGPEKIKVKRVDQDLHLSFAEGNLDNPDVIISSYYAHYEAEHDQSEPVSGLVGAAPEDTYYNYKPVEVGDFGASKLPPNEMALTFEQDSHAISKFCPVLFPIEESAGWLLGGAAVAATVLSHNDSVAVVAHPVNHALALDLDSNDSSGASGANYITSYAEGSSASKVAVVDADVSITGVDPSALISGALVKMTNGSYSDLLEVVGTLPTGITAAAPHSTQISEGVYEWTVALSGTASAADYQAALQHVYFDHTSANPLPGQRTIEISVHDSLSNSNTAITQLNVIAVNDAPYLVNPLIAGNPPDINLVDGTALFFTPISGGAWPLNINDPETGSFGLSAILTATHGTIHIDDSFLVAPVTNNDTQQVNFTGQVTQAVSQGLLYTPTSAGPETITYTVYDPQGAKFEHIFNFAVL